MQKVRLDQMLVDRGLASSREKAKAIVMSGIVYVNGQKEDKPGSFFPPDADVVLKGEKPRYVSRGGYKLEKAVGTFGIVLDGLVCCDIGSSTGGFTDCMLQNGAEKVYAIDVGRGQLDWKLRQDERVVSMERTNIRYVTPEDIGEPVGFASIDVSFISLEKVLPAVYELLEEGAHVAALIKPQFEAGRSQVGKKGVVRDPSVHGDVIEKVISVAASLGFRYLGLTYSPIRGPEGNIEYLLYMEKTAGECDVPDVPVKETVTEAFQRL